MAITAASEKATARPWSTFMVNGEIFKVGGALMPEYEVHYYAEEIGKYGTLPDGLSEHQMAQILEAMKEEISKALEEM